MAAEDVFPSMKAHHLVNKLLEKLECNAFAAPCPDMCATRRLNEGRFTLCLNHSLNNEAGVCSACEYDLSALASMVLLSNLSFSAPYMGNTSIGKISEAQDPTVSPLLTPNKDSYADASDAMRGANNVAYTFHAAPETASWPASARSRRPTPCAPSPWAGAGGPPSATTSTATRGRWSPCAASTRCAEKLFVARGTIVAGIGYKDENCTEGAFFEVADAKRFYECSLQVGNHIPLVYGDVYDNAIALAGLLGLEVLTCE